MLIVETWAIFLINIIRSLAQHQAIIDSLNCCLVLHGGALEVCIPWIFARHPIFAWIYSMIQAVTFGFRLLSVQGRDGLLINFLLVFFISRYAYWATHSLAPESLARPLVVSISSALPNKPTEFGTYIFRGGELQCISTSNL